MQTLKFGIIGAGFVARFHARALMQVRGVEIAGVTSRLAASAEAFSRLVKEHGLGDGHVYGSTGEMAHHVDALAIFAPNHTRLALMEEIAWAVKGGASLKGVICEKHLSRNMAEARCLVQFAGDSNLRTAYYENQIFVKPLRSQLAQLRPQQESMGPPVLTRSAEEHGGPHEPWIWDPTLQGGGVLSDMGCHSIAVGCGMPSIRPTRRWNF